MSAQTRRSRQLFTDRHGGFSLPPYDSLNLGAHVGDDPLAVERNRQRLAQTIGIPRESFVYMEQIHSTTVTVVDGPVDTPIPATDGVVTNVEGLALVVLVADCVPVLLSDDVHGVVAAVHAGRVGACDGIVKNAVAEMCRLGAKPSSIHASLGPAASGCRYEVPQSMAEDVDKHLPGSKCVTEWGTSGIDLRSGLYRQLQQAGVSAVDISPVCTISSADHFSYRREGATGRHAGIVMLVTGEGT